MMGARWRRRRAILRVTIRSAHTRLRVLWGLEHEADGGAGQAYEDGYDAADK
jgi:hypothetical protein